MYTSAQLIQVCLQICKAPGFTVQAGQIMNLVLADLALTYDFDFIRKTYVVTVGANAPLIPYLMPSDYLRAREVFYNISGAVTPLNQVPLEDFDQYFSGPGLNDYPESFATDTSTSPISMYFWPNPSLSIPITIRYQPFIADITTPESSIVIPWFTNQRYLIKKICADIMMITDDDRQEAFEKDAADILKRFLSMDDDKEGYARQVKLDGRTFRNRGNAKVTKAQPL